jgi:hypothetical protein
VIASGSACKAEAPPAPVTGAGFIRQPSTSGSLDGARNWVQLYARKGTPAEHVLPGTGDHRTILESQPCLRASTQEQKTIYPIARQTISVCIS